MSSSAAFIEAIKTRRTYYPLEKKSPISDAKIQEIIKECVLHVPSSFNSQSARVLLLLKDQHDELWEITKTAVKAVAPPAGWAATEAKLNMFKGAYGTVLFFDDRETIQEMQNTYAIYHDKFPIWAAESTAMHQFAVWTALELEGFGANLQHYDPLIDEKVASTWKLPETWKLKATLVFGTPTGPAGDKSFKPVEDRFKVFGA